MTVQSLKPRFPLSELNKMLLFTAFALTAPAIVIVHAGQADTTSLKSQEALTAEFERDYAQIQSYGNQRNLTLENFEKLAAKLDEKWRMQDKKRYSSILGVICRIVSSVNFDDKKQYLLAKEYGFKALQQLADLDDVAISREASLVLCLPHLYQMQEALQVTSVNVISTTDQWPKGTWVEFRQEKSRHLIHTLGRLDKEIDKDYNPADTANRWRMSLAPQVPEGYNYVPKKGELLMPGMRVADVDDPVIREAYRIAVERNNAKAKKETEQKELRDVERWFPMVAEKFLIEMYSNSPQDMEELEKLLRDSDVSLERKNELLSSIREELGKQETSAKSN
jgi:hypothetical protein